MRRISLRASRSETPGKGRGTTTRITMRPSCRWKFLRGCGKIVEEYSNYRKTDHREEIKTMKKETLLKTLNFGSVDSESEENLDKI